jgi:GT2 family glycosyltransferase
VNPATNRRGEATPTVSAVVLAYREEPWLERSVHALLDSRGVDVDVVLVDNGCTDGTVDRLAPTPGVTVVRPGENLGFAGGCNAGAAAASREFLALMNGDLVVEEDALAKLVTFAQRPDVGVAQPSIRLSDDPSRLNSDGNEVHFLGFSWCGSFREPATKRTAPRPIPSVMGAAMVVRRELWDELGGLRTPVLRVPRGRGTLPPMLAPGPRARQRPERRRRAPVRVRARTKQAVPV